jgi:hypothetical protein
MPSSSKKQHRFMEAIAHNPGFAKKVGIPQSVGKDFSNADKGKSFSKGGDMATKMNPGFMAMMAKKKGAPAKKMAGGGMPMKDGKPTFVGDGKGMMNKGGMTKMATGGFVRAADGVASKGKTKAKQIKMKSGGMAC